MLHRAQMSVRAVRAARVRSSSSTGGSSWQSVGIQEAYSLYEDGDRTYLDVRTKEEFQKLRVPGSINVPIFEVQDGQMVPNEKFIEEVEKAIPQKSTPLLVACKAGPRSKQASDVLASAGYQDIIEADGGIMAWSSIGPVEQPEAEDA